MVVILHKGQSIVRFLTLGDTVSDHSMKYLILKEESSRIRGSLESRLLVDPQWMRSLYKDPDKSRMQDSGKKIFSCTINDSSPG